MLVDNVSGIYVERDTPEYDKNDHADYTNEYLAPVEAIPTDHAMLAPLPAPGGRPAFARFQFLDRVWGLFQSGPGVLSGETVRADQAAKYDPDQGMGSIDVYQAGTLRIEPEPWGADLYGA